MIRIVTDSAADLTAEELSVPGIFVVPLSVTFADGTTQLDDGTMTKDEFFVRLAEDSKLPRTSQPSPASFMQVYEDAAAAGDEVLVITIGQKLSGTYQCAHLAAADVGLQAHIVDSEAASQAEALLVREAVRLRDEEGLTAEEIAARVDMPREKVAQLLQLSPDVCSLDVPVGDEDKSSFGNLLEDLEAPQPQEELVRKELNDAIDRLLSNLTERQRTILRLHFGMEDGVCHSLEEIGQKLGISKERVRQVEKQAMDKLQALGTSMGLEDFLE